MLKSIIATVEDEQFLFELYASTRWDEVTSWGWGELECRSFLTMQWRMQCQSYKLQFPDAENIILVYEGSRIGRVMIQRTLHKIHLIDISFLSAFRNRGFGTVLLHNLQQEASVRQQLIELHVTPHNRARHLYERLGFQVQASQELYWKMVWQPQSL